ncbi:MAG TPA: thymidine phosphorylase [Candidatus Absconditabacterales bacterium]|nr:thymidine phosphorylase [Candidatus Absconditabacterales bacterium]
MKNKKNSFYAKTKNIDIIDGDELIAVISKEDGEKHGMHAMDKVALRHKGKEIVLNVDLSNHLVRPGEVGLFEDVYKKYSIPENESVELKYARANPTSIEAIRKKLLGEKLTEQEIEAIVDDIKNNRLSDTHVTYFTACGFFYKSVNNELVRMTKATAKSGNCFNFGKKAVSKYCIGGVPSNETSMIIIPLLASLGITMPKSFSKAITSPAATGECVSVLMNIKFTPDEVKKLVKKNNSCLVRSEPLNLAPANDKIIKVSNAISMEPYSRMISSIMAKQHAMGITDCLIDIPVGSTAKIPTLEIGKRIKRHFSYIGKKLGMNMKVLLTDADQPVGKSIGAALQVKEVLEILQQKKNKSELLEKKALFLAKEILEMIGFAHGIKAQEIVEEGLKSGKARKKMQEIIKMQGGRNWNIKPDEIKIGEKTKEIKATKNGEIDEIDMKHINTIARTLGCPFDLKSGIVLHFKKNNKFKKGEILITLYSSDENKLKTAIKMLDKKNIYSFKK